MTSLELLNFTTGSLPVELQAYFTSNTPRVEGSNVVFHVETNKPASLRCRLIGGVVAVECKFIVLLWT